MKLFLSKLKSWVFVHKKISVILLIGIIVSGYFLFRGQSVGLTIYVLAATEKGTLISSISGSGQVEASSQVDLKADSAGKIIYISVKPGQQVAKGKTLFVLDARDAQKTVRNAEIDLETVKLELEKFKQEPTNLDVQLLEAEITKAEKSKTDADKTVQQAYRNLLNTSTAAISNVYNDTRTPPTITGTYNKNREATIHINMYEGGDWQQYFNVSSIPSGIVLGSGTVNTNIPQPLGDSGLYIKFASSSQNFIGLEWIITLPNKTMASYSVNLKAYDDALDAQEKTIREADLTITENKQKINDLYQPDALELRSKELAVRQKEDAFLDAQSNLSNYYVSAPFAGIISNITAKVGDTASGTLGTIITKQKVATISLNEVDIAKIKLGQKATLAFDAIEDLSITGEIAEIDATGTVSQGVVNYNVKIAFDTDSDKVKPGMSVSASIITNMKQDILMVPISAVKTNAFGSYIEKLNISPRLTANAINGVPSEIPPKKIPVEIGISNDESIEIISGLKEGEQIVTRTVTSTSSSSASTQAPSLFGSSSTGTRGGFTPR